MNKKSSGKLIFAGIIFVMFFSICSNITITTPDQDFIAKMTTSIDTPKDSSVETKPFVKNTGIIWNFSGDSPYGSYSSPAVEDGFVYAGNYDGNLYCLNASNGNKIWNYTTNDTIYSSPTIENGFVYFGSMDNNVYCLNASNGNWVWNFTTGDIVVSSPVVENGLVYVGSNDGNIYCLNSIYGNKVWNYTTGAEVDSSPAFDNGFVYFGSADFNVYCFNTSGSKIWNYTTGDRVDSSPAVVNGSVYIGSEDNNIYCLNASLGTKIWNYTTGWWVDSSPAVYNGLVYVGSKDNTIYCVNASTGSFVWQQLLDGYVISSPAVADGLVYIGSEANKIFCLNASSGIQLWYYNTTSHIVSRPTIDNGYVYITCSIGQNSGVVCFPMMFVASAPQHFQAIGGVKKIILNWGNPVINLGPEYFYFNIYRGTSPENLTYLTMALKGMTVNHTYTDTGLADATPYFYKITALCEGFDSNYEGFFSQTINATTGTTTPSMPTELKINATNEGQIVLSWQPPQSDGGLPITSYKIYRGMNPDAETVLATVSGSTLNYTDTGLTNKQEYYYKVSAVNEIGEGSKSSEVMAIFKGQEPPDDSIGGTSFILLLSTSFIGVITVASIIRKRYKMI